MSVMNTRISLKTENKLLIFYRGYYETVTYFPLLIGSTIKTLLD